jgi:hypothetical protein
MSRKLKLLFIGFVIGIIVGFPLGINFGRGEPLWSNPFAKRAVKSQVKAEAEKALEGARESIHKATEPVKKKLNQ